MVSRFRNRLPGSMRLVVPAAVAAVALSSVAVASAPAPSTAGPGGGGNTVSDGADPTAPSLSLGHQWWPYSTGPGQLGAIPQAFAYDQVIDGRRTKKTLMTVTRNEDSSSAKLKSTMKVAEDNSLEFTDFSKLPQDFNWSSSGRLTDGTVKLVKFVPASTPARISLSIASTTDLGKTWEVHNAPVTEDKWRFDWYRVTHQLLELNDGTLVQPMYAGGTLDGVAGTFTLLLQSTDKGKTWTQRSLINTDGDSSELGISRTSDGRLIAITRANEGSGKPGKPMKQTYSDDDGLTWAPQTTFVPPEGLPAVGILPELALQTNGALLLSYGRPDNHVAVSWDGTGRTWDDGKVVFANYIRETERGRSMGSSGNTSIVATGANYSMNFGDICHNIWTCAEYGQQVGAWTRRVDAVTEGKGKIDLATGVRTGAVTLSGTVVEPDDRFAEQRLEGAVDGSNEYRAAARFPEGAPGEFTVKLDRIRTLDKIGLMLDRGVQNGAKVEVSLDGKTWSGPVVQQKESVDYAVRYHDIEPVQARYVRVSHHGAAPLTAVNELELYAANTWTFENDAIYGPPRGATDTLHAFVADTIMPGQDSERRAIIVDMDPDTRGTMTFPVEPASGLHLSYGYSGEGYGSGGIWELLGTDADGNETTVWKFHFRPGGDGFLVSAWDGAAWQEIGSFPTFTPNYQWIPVQIDADTEQAALTVHGRTLTTTVTAGSADTLHAFRPSTGLNVADQNMEHSFDNLEITPLADQVASPPNPEKLLTYPNRPVTATFTISNFTDRRAVLLGRSTPIPGYTVKVPRHVMVPANSSTEVEVSITRTTDDASPTELELMFGDARTSVPIEGQNDWARIATMAHSSTGSARGSAENLNDGNTDSNVWGPGGAFAWNDGTGGVFPDWVTAAWTEPVTLGRVDVYTLNSAAEPSHTHGVRDYDVQVKAADDSWQTVAEVRGNTDPKISSTFEPVETTGLRILITDTNDHRWSRLIAVQAFSS